MLGTLRDIAPVSQTIDVRGTEVVVQGIPMRAITGLMARFPALAKAINEQKVSIDLIFEAGPEAVAAVIAAGCGKRDDKETEEAADNLAIGDQLILIAGILEATLPDGISPFIERLSKLGLARLPVRSSVQ